MIHTPVSDLIMTPLSAQWKPSDKKDLNCLRILRRLKPVQVVSMEKLIPVEEAKALFTEAQDWSLWRWLKDKKKARAAGNAATEAFDTLDKKIKDSWAEDLKKAYRELEAEAAADGNAKSRRQYEKAKEEARDIDAKIKLAVKRVKQADDEAYRARMDTEAKFDEAEERLSANLAREGAVMALESWRLREAALRKAAALGRRK